MRFETIKHHRRVIIEPGEYYASRQPVTISTLLGSCVSACIFDPVNKVIGMNHFLLSNHRYPQHLPMIEADAGRYGVHSMELLINEMLRLGAQKRFFKAKAFGGSIILKNDNGIIGNFFCVGDVNVKFIREFLDKEEIPLLAADLGGSDGRVIHFSSGDYAVYVRKIKSENRSRQLAMRDRNCWLHAIEEQEKVKSLNSNVELWD